MDILKMIIYTVFALSFLVVIHEAGHYLCARMFGVRVKEFMIGLPGPSIGFERKGTRFGVTPILLGGYANICGMAPEKNNPHLQRVLAYAYSKGTVLLEDVARDLEITVDSAAECLDQLVDWGSLVAPLKKDQFNIYRTPSVHKKHEQGHPRDFTSAEDLFISEKNQQYSSIGFWKKTLILLGGIIFNLIFAILVFILVFSVLGMPMPLEDGSIQTVTVGLGQAIAAGFSYIANVFVYVLGLLNPVTMGETISNSMSVVGIASVSKEYADMGAASFLMFMAMISVSLGLMNALPVYPLDGGRLLVEIISAIIRRPVSERILNILGTVGTLAFVLLFVVLLFQDVTRLLPW